MISEEIMLIQIIKCILAGTLGLFLVVPPTSAIILNFSATINEGTCTLSLDKSALSLGDISQNSLTAETLVSAEPFTLQVTDCQGSSVKGLVPIVKVTGTGVTQDNKWLFRQDTSSSSGAGILVIQSNSVPNYSQSEVKNGATYPLAAGGQTPLNQELSFYAGVSCGGNSGCSVVNTGVVTAKLLFEFNYQ